MGNPREKMQEAKDLLSEARKDADIPLEDALQRIQTRIEFAIRTYTSGEKNGQQADQ